MTLSDVLARLPGHTRTRNGYMARCPAHHDAGPSLCVSEGHMQPVVLHCFAGCSYEAIVRALGLEGERPHTEQEPVRIPVHVLLRRQQWRRPEVALRYAYADLARYTYHLAQSLHHAVERLGPDDPDAWDMLDKAVKLEHELRYIEEEIDALQHVAP